MPARKKRDLVLSSMAEVDRARNDYSMAKRSGAQTRKRRGVPSRGAGADYHYRTEADWLWMQELAWDLYRNNMALGSITDRAVENQLQGGFNYDPKTGDDRLDKDLRQWWKDISDDATQCDPDAELSFPEQEEIVFRSTLVAGDIFGVPMDDGTVDLVESFLCRSPTRRTRENIIHGVEFVPGTFRRAAYWFLKGSASTGGGVRKCDLTPVVAWDDDGERNVFHVRMGKRAKQTRGITAYTPLFDCAGYHDDVQFLKMVQARAASLFVFVRQRSATFDPAYLGADMALGPDVTSSKAETASDFERQYQEVAAGSDIKSLPGETINPWSSNIPNPEFFPHAKMLLTFIGINLGMPLVMAMMDASETNFSGYRGAVNQARLGFQANQRRIIRRFHTPYMRFKIFKRGETDSVFNRHLLRSLRPNTKINVLAHRWNPPTWPYIEPTKDAQADITRKSNMLSSPRRISQERGFEYREIATETIEDHSQTYRDALDEAFKIIDEYAPQGLVIDPDSLAMRLAPITPPDRTTMAFRTSEEQASGSVDEEGGVEPEAEKPAPKNTTGDKDGN